jgi:hypothetical protein
MLQFLGLLACLIIIPLTNSQSVCDYTMGDFFVRVANIGGNPPIGSVVCSPGSFFSPNPPIQWLAVRSLVNCMKFQTTYATDPALGAALWFWGTPSTSAGTSVCPVIAVSAFGIGNTQTTYIDCNRLVALYLCVMPATQYAATTTSTTIFSTTGSTESSTSVSLTTQTVFLLTATTTTSLEVDGSTVIFSQTRSSITSTTTTTDTFTSTSSTSTETLSFLSMTTISTSFTQTDFSTISQSTTVTITSLTTSTLTSCSTIP